MLTENRNKNRRFKWLDILMLCFLIHGAQGALNLFIDRRFAIDRMGYDVKNDIFLIRNGVKNEVFKNPKLFRESTKSLSPSLNRVELTWLATQRREHYELRLKSGNLDILKDPTSTIPLKGEISKGSKTFAITLQCTGLIAKQVNIHFTLNYTNYIKKEGRTVNRSLDFIIAKSCDLSERRSDGSTKSSENTPIDRTVVVTVSAVLALLVCLIIAVVFFCRYVKRINRRYGFDEATEQLSPRSNSCSSSNISIPQTSHVPTVVYSPKRNTSGQFVTKIAKHESATTTIQDGHACVNSPVTSARDNALTSSVSLNRQSSSENSQILTQISLKDDDVFESSETDVAVVPKHEDTLSIAKDMADRQLAFSTLNEYWSEKLGDVVKPYDQVQLRTEVLGEGTFGRVRRGKLICACEQTEKYVDLAVKICQEDIEFDHMISFVNEAILMKKLSHNNLLPLIGVVLQPNAAPLILTPYILHGDLHKFLRHSRGIGIRRQLIGSRQLVNFGSQVAKGMAYLSSQKIIHRDLAARNCLVDENLNVKIGDFGLARETKEFGLYKMEHPTQLAVKWLALESLMYYIFTEKSDVWSFGIVLWELVTLGSQPYAGLDNYEVVPYLETGKRLPRPLRCPDDLYNIMQSCWLPLREDRPSFDVLVHKLEDYELRLRPSCITFEFDEDTMMDEVI